MNVFQPLNISLGKTFRNKFRLSGSHCFHGRSGQRFHLYKPLFRSHWFHHRLAAGAVTYSMLRFFNLYQQTGLLEIFNNGFSGFIAVHAAVSAGLFIHCAVLVHDDNGGQVMALAYFKVVGVMGRCNLHAAGTIVHIYIIISNNGDFAIRSRKLYLLTYQMSIPFIFGIHSYSRIAWNRFRTGRSNFYISVFSDDRIVEIPEMTHFVLMFYFNIRECRLAAGAPVGDAESLIDKTFFVERNKNFTDSPGAYIVHGKPFPFPVAGRAETANLQSNAVSEFFLPLPYSFQELFTAQIVLIETFLGNLLFHLHLGSNACMVLARQPEYVVALHSFITNKDILQCIIQGMTHMQLACYVWRRQHNAVWFLGRIRFIMKYIMILPELIPLLLNRSGVIFAKIFKICHIFHS